VFIRGTVRGDRTGAAGPPGAQTESPVWTIARRPTTRPGPP
jgi:hypothetical protein